MSSHPICILSDICYPLPTYSPHNFAPAPPPAPIPMPAIPMSPAPASAFDPPAPMLWPPGNALFQNKYAPTVTHKGLSIIQANHDLGVMLPHVQITPSPSNFYTPLHILFSSRKVMFSSGTVKVGGAFVGFAGILGGVPAPMMICGDPLSFPMGEVPTRWLNNVWVGFTPTDMALGALAVVAQIISDKILMPKGKYGPLKGVVKGVKEGMGAQIYKNAFPMLVKNELASSLKKQVAGALCGAVNAVVLHDGGTSMTIGSPYVNLSIGAGWDQSGAVNVSVGVQSLLLAVSDTQKQGEGNTVTASASWGTGGSAVTNGAAGDRAVTHNALDGTVEDSAWSPNE